VHVERHTGAWVGATVFAALTVIVLMPAGWYVRLNLPDTGDWQTNHANHEAAARAVLLVIAATSGAFTGALLLTVIGFAWILTHTHLMFGD
jgi:hypothetical protein